MEQDYFKQNTLYDFWNNEKKILTKNPIYIFAKIRDICYVKLGINIGFEENGKRNFSRPVLIVSKIGSLYFVIPLTSKYKENKFHYLLQSISFENKKSLLILSQGKVIDGRRLYKKIGRVSKTEFLQIKKILKELYFPSE